MPDLRPAVLAEREHSLLNGHPAAHPDRPDRPPLSSGSGVGDVGLVVVSPGDGVVVSVVVVGVVVVVVLSAPSAADIRRGTQA